MIDREGRRGRTSALVRALCERHGAPARDDLVEALFVDGGDGWLAGVAELSLSLRGGRPVAIRALAEILQPRTLEPALVEAGLAWGTAVLDRAGGTYDAGRFQALYRMIYAGELADPAPVFRFGIAAALGGAAPVIKVYFDLHAVALRRRRDTLARTAELLGETAGLAVWARVCPAVDFETSRVIGVDFGADNTVRTKFYWGTRRLDWPAIRAAARALAGERHLELIERLERDVVAGSPESSVMISMCGAGGARSLKLDVCIARLFDDDGRAHAAIARFAGGALEAPLAIVTGGLAPAQTRCVQQYLGLELSRDREARVTIYYRPLDLEAAHLNPALRPRRCA